jgi:hypothetical protein
VVLNFQKRPPVRDTHKTDICKRWQQAQWLLLLSGGRER